jgi:predicted RNA methylase
LQSATGPRALDQIARLRPVQLEARAAESELHARKTGAKDLRAQAEQMERLRWIPGFFPTPRALALRMIDEAGSIAGKRVLEPSAGKGDIAQRALELGADLFCIESSPALCDIIKNRNLRTLNADFLEVLPAREFDFVLMNPPFENRADQKHIEHAFEFLKDGGRLVAICSSTTGARLESWTAERSGFVEPLPPGSFATSERPTGVNCALVVVDR